MNSKRIEWIDTAKGIGMLLVMLGHFGCGSLIRNIIYSFHMPLFFFLSGYVYKDNGSIRDFLSSRMKKIVIPYYSLGFVMLVFYVLHGCCIDHVSTEKIVSVALNFLFARRQWTIWFLATLLTTGLLQFTLNNYIKNEKIKIVLIALCPILGMVYYSCGGVALPWNVDVSLMAIPFFYVGYRVKQSNCIEKKLSNKKWIATGTICGIVCLGFMCLNIKSGGGIGHVSCMLWHPSGYLRCCFCRYCYCHLLFICVFPNQDTSIYRRKLNVVYGMASNHLPIFV